MEFFFKRLEAYIKVRPTAAMTDIVVKIMVEVISILGIVTKEIGQGRISMPFPVDVSPKFDLPAERYLKKLFGINRLEDALRRLDKLSQEEARMAAAEILTITSGIDDTVKDVDERLEGVDERVQSVVMKVEGIEDKVQSVDSKVQDVDEKMKGVDDRVKVMSDRVKVGDDRVKVVDDRVKGIDHKVGSVIEGELYLHWSPPRI
jgi:archaellum component FlaC